MEVGMIQQLRQWWRRPEAAAVDDSVSPEFAQSCASLMLEGCADRQSQLLRLRVADARRQEDLRHLRPLVYDCVARRFGEPEARRRLALVQAGEPARTAPLTPDR
jgi:hypothetical protein